MQLKSLYIKEYKILKDFTIEFPYDFERYISVFIGANGSGKSTILEAVAEIFSCSILKQKAKFTFEIEYQYVQSFLKLPDDYDGLVPPPFLIKLFAQKGEVPTRKIVFEEGNVLADPPFEIAPETAFLPDRIVIYYSGLSEHMDVLCKKHEEIQRKEFHKGNYLAQRSFFYYRPENFNMLLLSLLSFEYGEIKDFVFKKLNIAEVAGFTIKLKRPNKNWAKGKKSDKLWGAEGVIKEFGLTLSQLAKFTISENNDKLLSFSFNSIKQLYALKDHYISELKLFELLDMANYEGMLDSITISLIKGEKKKSSISSDGEIVFNSSQLSEGEQQIIIIKGLTELIGQKNSLFLFDEPDTYLHPEWQRQFITDLENTVTQSSDSENSFLIATHSPQILSNAKAELNFVKIIENGVLVENTPKFYGREISSILYNLMGVEERNETIKSDLSKLFALIEAEEAEEAEKELIRLTEILGETDPDIKNAEIQLTYLREDEANN